MRTTRPVLWRNASEIQIGTGEHATVLADLTASETDLILDLAGGRRHSPTSLEKRGVSPERWEFLTNTVTSARELPPATRLLRFRPVALDSHPLTSGVVDALSPLALRKGEPLAVLSDWYVTDPVRTRPLLRKGAPFLPLVIDDDGVTLGPIILPGVSACPRCLELARTDADPAWPAVATQLRLMPPGQLDQLLLTAAIAAAVIGVGLGAEQSEGWRVEAGGIGRFTVAPYRDCGCIAPEPALAPVL